MTSIDIPLGGKLGDIVLEISLRVRRGPAVEKREPSPVMEPLPVGPTLSSVELQAGTLGPATAQDREERAVRREANFKDAAAAMEASAGLYNPFTLYRRVYACSEEEAYRALSGSAFEFHRPNEPVPDKRRDPGEVQAAEAFSLKWRRLMAEAVTFVNRPAAKGGTMQAERVNVGAAPGLTAPKALLAMYPDQQLDPWLLSGASWVEVKKRPPADEVAA